jgi:large conductance mechanosensitive channel
MKSTSSKQAKHLVITVYGRKRDKIKRLSIYPFPGWLSFKAFIFRLDDTPFQGCLMSQKEVLEELKKITTLLTPKPAPPPPPPPKGMWAEFIDFIGKAGVLGLAIGFIMGTYIGKVVSALVSDIIMPIPGAFITGGDWRQAIVTLPIGNGINFAVGDFVGVIIDFIIVAIVIFYIAKYAKKMGLK